MSIYGRQCFKVGLSNQRNPSQNLEYARTLLLRLEHDTSAVKIQSRKAAAQSSLSHSRTLIKRLTNRMQELEQTGDDDDILNGPLDEEDILASEDEKPPVPTTDEPDDTGNHHKHSISTNHRPPPPQSILRNRFQPSSDNTQEPPSTETASRLQANDTETADLTGSLLALAQSLKASSTQFSDSLTADNEALRRATEGLDKNETGMDAASRRMGMLRKMSEGQGWWGRMMLYAWIAGLWLFAILLVFVGPKLRF